MGRILEGVAHRAPGHLGQQLRSLMSVLGNIVAVTSIIAVVSLIQGLNATVTDAIVSRWAPTLCGGSLRRHAQPGGFDKVRSNPDHDALMPTRFGDGL